MQKLAEEILTHLKSFQFRELDQILNNSQLDYEEGRMSEAQLHQIFSTFCKSDESLKRPLDEYVLKYSGSYPARLAHGIFYVEFGWSKRSYAFASELSESQINGFIDCLDIAHESLTVSLALTRNPILSYVQLLIIAMGLGKEKVVEQSLYLTALELAPKSLLIRKQFLRNLRPQWGGSLKEVQEFSTRSQNKALSIPDYVELVASKYYILNHYYLAVDTQILRSIFEFTRALGTQTFAKFLRIVM